MSSSLDYWRQRWSKGDTPWVCSSAHPKLLAYLHLLTRGRDPKEAGLFMIPLCGKTVDLKFLYQLGFVVLGVECCELAIREFIAESGLEFEEKKDERIGKVFVTSDGRLRIFCGDVLKMTRDIVGQPVQMVWDRAALHAVDKEIKKQYAEVMKSLLGPGARYLTACVEYKDWFFNKSPYNTPQELVNYLFKDRFQNIELLDSGDLKFPGVDDLQVPVTQNIFIMTE